MVKKTKLEDRDPLSLDDELNLSFDDPTLPPPKDDRSPVKKIIGSIKDGAKDAFTDQTLLKKFMRKALPEVYGEVLDIGDEITTNTKKLYNNAVAEIKPSLNELGKASDKLLPQTFKRSKGILDRINKWSNSNTQTNYSDGDKAQQREKNIAIELADVFKFQMEEGVKADVRKESDAKVQESLNIVRHRQSLSSMNSMGMNIARMTQYQERVTAAYQKKSLELQYRSYFLTSEAFEETKRNNAVAKANLEAIAKNTALPEFVKIKNSERLKEVIRTKAMEGLFGNATTFIRKMFANLGQKVQETTNLAKDAFSTASMGLESVSMMSELEGRETSLQEKIAKYGTGFIVENAATRLGNKLNGVISKNKKVDSAVQDANYAVKNIPQIVTGFAQGDGSKDGLLKSLFRSGINSLISGNQTDLGLDQDKVEQATDPTIFTKYTNKSITEIIPGYLARIFRELQVIRTGDATVQLTRYDPYSNKFVSSGALKNRVIGTLFKKSDADQHKASGDEIFALIDPDNKLSPEVRKALLDKLTMERLTNKTMDRDRLANKESFMSDDQLSDFAEQIAKGFEAYYTKNGTEDDKTSLDYKKRNNQINSKLLNLGSVMTNPSAQIQQLINLGLYDTLEELGLLGMVTKTKKVKKAKTNEFGRTIDHTEELESYQENGADIKTVFDYYNGKQIPTVQEDTRMAKNPSTIILKRTKPTIASQTKNTGMQPDSVKQFSDILMESSSLLKAFVNTSQENNIRYQEFLKEQTEAIKGLKPNDQPESTVSYIENTNSILTRIEDFLINKLKITVGRSSEERKVESEERKGFMSVLKSVIGNTSNKLSGVALNIGKFGIKNSMKSVSAAMSGLGKSTRFLADRLIKKRDIFVEGELKARITKAGLEAGKYYDSVTGKVIKTIDDLKDAKGDIFDKDGTVLKMEEIAKTFVKRIDGTGIWSLGKYLVSKGFDASRFVSEKIFSGISGGMSLVNTVRKSIVDFIDAPIDVYVRNNMEKPVLYAYIMKNGGYRSKKTNQVITKMSEIDGEVLDEKNNIVLNEEQLKIGIVDVRGRKIVTPLFKVLRFVGNTVGAGFKLLTKASSAIAGAIGGGFNKAGDFLNGMLDTLSTGLGGKKSLEVLEEIRDIIKAGLPASRRKNFRDRDGDGDRDGSWQDKFANDKNNKKETVKAERKDPTVKPDRKNIFDVMQEKVGAVKDGILKALGFGGDGGGIDIDIDGKGKKVPGAKPKGGFLSKVGRGLMSVIKGGASLLMGAARFGLPALAGILGGAGSAIAATGGALASGAMGLAGLAGSLLSAPVVLGVGATALAGYGAYKLYKYVTKPNMEPLSKIRMSQYGFTKDDLDYISKIQAFEKLMLEQVKYDSEQRATLDGAELDIKEVYGFFDLNPELDSPKEKLFIKRWNEWFINRFKTVFLTHLTVLNSLDDKQTLFTTDKLDREIKLKYIEHTSLEDVNFDAMLSSPFKDIPQLQSGNKLVKYNIEQALKALEETKPKENKSAIPGEAAGAAVAAAGAKDKDSDTKAKDKSPEAPKPIMSRIADTMKSVGKTMLDALKWTPGYLIASAANNAFTYVGQKVGRFLGYKVTPIEGVRFRAYGLVDMDRSKVQTLRSIEEAIAAKVTYDTDNAATWKDSIEAIVSKFSGNFGFNAEETDRVEAFTKWFGSRFLPVFTTYLGYLRSATGKGDFVKAELAAKPSDLFDIAGKLKGLTGTWSNLTSPWPGYELNKIPSSCDGSIAVLDEGSKAQKLAEVTAPKKKDTLPNGNNKGLAGSKPGSGMSSGIGAKKDVEPVAGDKTTVAGNKPEVGVQKTATGVPNSSDRGEAFKKQAVGVSKKMGKFDGFGHEVDGYISEAAKKYGIDEQVLRGFVKMEAGWTGKMSPTGAIGTGQFIQSTWNNLAETPEGKEIGMTKITSSNFRTPQDPRFDKRINTLATGLLAKNNAKMLEKAGLPLTGENLYMVHNVGPGVIPAIKTGEAPPKTIEAMRHNGMKPGESAADFVNRQKGIFNQHMASANSTGVTTVASDTKVFDENGQWNDYKDPSKVPGASNPKPMGEGQPVVKESRAVNKTDKALNTAKITPASSSPTMNAGVSQISTSARAGYMGSVNPNSGSPIVEKQAIPNETSPYAQGPAKDMQAIANARNRQQQRPIDTSVDLKQVLGNVGNSMAESVGIQKQMLDVLRQISGSVDPKAVISAITDMVKNQQPAPTVEKTVATEQPRMVPTRQNNTNDTFPMKQVPVPMSNTKY